jgi:hypothetical protein
MFDHSLWDINFFFLNTALWKSLVCVKLLVSRDMPTLSRVSGKLTGTPMIKNFPPLMATEYSLQEQAIGSRSYSLNTSVDILTPCLFKLRSSINSYICLVNPICVFLHALLLNFIMPYSFFPFVFTASPTVCVCVCVCVCNICREQCVICCLICRQGLSKIGLVDRDIMVFYQHFEQPTLNTSWLVYTDKVKY